MREFDNLVRFADARTEAGQKVGSDLRPEAVQYLGVSFAEPDWDGDTLPDPITGLQRALDFYKGREGEKHVREVFQRLGDIYFDQTKYADAIAVYKTLLSKWPYYVDAPKVQDRIVHAYEKDRNLVAAAKEREALGRNYTKGSDWYQHNRENPEALAAAQELAEDALLTAATNVHAGAQACKTKWQENQKDTAKLEECKKLYATAADLYEKYLAAYPNSKRVYEFSAFYADALYYSGQLPQAIAAYKVVRDSILDNRYQEDAAFRMIKGYEEIIGDMKAQKKIAGPADPRREEHQAAGGRHSDAGDLQEVPRRHRLVRRQRQERPGPRSEVRGGGHRAALPRLAGRARAPRGDHREVLRHEGGRRLQGLRRDLADLLHRLQRRGRRAEGLRARQAAHAWSTSSASRPAERRPRRSPIWRASRRSSRR